MAPESIQEREARSRTRLANERTYLAWWRTGLTCFAVAIGVGRLIPAVTKGATRWPYAVLGVGFAVLGVVLIGFGHRRFRDISRDRHGWRPHGRQHGDRRELVRGGGAGPRLVAVVLAAS